MNKAQLAWQSVVDDHRESRIEFSAAHQRWHAIMEGIERPWPMCFASEDSHANSNIAKFCKRHGLANYQSLHEWSIRERGDFWSSAIEQLEIKFKTPPSSILELVERKGEASAEPRATADSNTGSAGDSRSRLLPDSTPSWLPGAKWNIVESCFCAKAESTAVVYGDVAGKLCHVTLGQLREDMMRVAGALRAADFQPGDAIAIMMPMNYESVMAYLGILAAGCVAVSIADSFAPAEIRKRLEISDAKAIICQSSFLRLGKPVDIWSRVIEANPKRAIVIGGNDPSVLLREEDLDWHAFLLGAGSLADLPPAVMRDSMDTINILFSSGTTGDPKAIPWNQATPIKCAMDGFIHQDIRPGDVVAWPTNLGWMMGPWLIFASLMNRATIALFDDAPVGAAFGRFVQDAKVSMLGVVPTLVRAWRASASMEEFDWSAIRCFSSTGEASNPDDMFYLSWLAGFKPVIEYCGGTEIGGGYISSTVVQPNAPAAFSAPGIGNELLIMAAEEDLEAGAPVDSLDEGSLYLVPPTIGMSTRLLNRDHYETYFAGLPKGPDGQTLRRHGDHFRRLRNAFGEFYVAGGRVDDTMNLGGIKTSSAEIEKALNRIESVSETAAIAVPASDAGGPEQLVVFVVLGDAPHEKEALLNEMNATIREMISPLFKVTDVVVVNSLPRTASNKVMRRKLRDAYGQ